MQRLLADVVPHLEPAYRRISLSLEAVMLLCVREELDRGAARRVDENRTLRAIFADAAPHVADAALRQELREAAGGEDASLLVPDLERTNQELRGLLIRLHADVETQDAPEARRVEAAIWRELRASTERRKLALAPF